MDHKSSGYFWSKQDDFPLPLAGTRSGLEGYVGKQVSTRKTIIINSSNGSTVIIIIVHMT